MSEQTGESPSSQIKEDIKADQFDRTLIEMTHLPWAYGVWPTHIDTGASWASRMDQLMVETMNHPDKVEHARTALVRNGVIHYDQQSTIGKITDHGQEVVTVIPVRTQSYPTIIKGQVKVYTKTDAGLLQIHTHGDQFEPPSPSDFTRLLIEGSHPAATVMEAIVTQNLRILMFRTLESPELALERALNNVGKWVQTLRTKLATYQEHHDPGEDYNRYKYRVGSQALRDIAKATKVRLYSSTGGSQFTRFE